MQLRGGRLLSISCSSIGCSTTSKSVLKLGEEQSQFYATIPPLAMAVGMPLGGWISDRLFSRLGWRAARAGLAMIGDGGGGRLAAVGDLDDRNAVDRHAGSRWPWASSGMAEGPFWVTAVEVGGRAAGCRPASSTPAATSAESWRRSSRRGSATRWASAGKAAWRWPAAFACVGAVLWYWIDADPTVGATGSPTPVRRSNHRWTSPANPRVSDTRHENHQDRLPRAADSRLRRRGLLVGAGRPGGRDSHRRGTGRHRRDRHQSLGRPRVHSGPRHALHGPGTGGDAAGRRAATIRRRSGSGFTAARR